MRLRFGLLFLSMSIGFACATGGSGNGDDTIQPDAHVITHPDAPQGVFPDAPPFAPDAHPPHVDAWVPPPIDAPGPPGGADGSILPTPCMMNSDCTAAGTCCFFAFCVPGTPMDPLCIPS
jgi:hypothetical protein